MRTFDIVPFDKKSHYEIVSHWWREHEWPVIPLEMLSTTGFVALVNGAPICAGWLYSTDSKICWLEYLISNPHSASYDRSTALDALVDELAYTAKNMGFSAIFTSTNHKGLIERYKHHDFKVADEDMINLVRKI